jgi:adenylate cyclase
VRTYAMSAVTVASTPLVPVPAQPSSSRRTQRQALIATGALTVIAAAILAWWSWLPGSTSAVAVPKVTPPSASVVPTPSAPRLSIMVLPFANLSNDQDQEYFADGITDDLTTDLSRISGSFVIARNTAFTYKGKMVDAKQLGRELGIRYVLEGSVRRAGEQIRVNVQLIDAETGAHVWADRFDTDRSNVAEAQDSIVGRLARSLNLELVRDAGPRIEREKAANPDARDVVMRAWALWYGPGYPANAKQTLREFERALEIDPRSVDAKLGVARMLVGIVGDGLSSSVQQDLARAEELLSEVLEHDPNRSLAHAVLGVLRRIVGRLAEAQSELEAAVALDRNDAWAVRQLGLTLSGSGQPEAAIPYLEKAIRLNPREPTVGSVYAALGANHLYLGHTEQAIQLERKARAENPRIWWIRLGLAGSLGLNGDIDEARAEIAEALKLKPEVNSVAKWRALGATMGIGDPRQQALMEKTVYTLAFAALVSPTNDPSPDGPFLGLMQAWFSIRLLRLLSTNLI